MVYKGTVKGGVVVLEADSTLAEGTQVLIQPLARGSAATGQPTIWQKLRKYAGVVTGLPTDMARNHDHYIHGQPTRSGH